MYAITLTQPWASLVALGAKRIETRSWQPRGYTYPLRLAIHAGTGLGPVSGRRGLRKLVASEPFYSALVDTVEHTPQKSLVDGTVDGLPRGAIVAVCSLMACWPMAEGWDEHGNPAKGYNAMGRFVAVSDQEAAFGDWSLGRQAWLLSDVRPLREPVPIAGHLGLWRIYSPEIIAAIEAQL